MTSTPSHNTREDRDMKEATGMTLGDSATQRGMLRPSEILRNARTTTPRFSTSPSRSTNSGTSVPSPWHEMTGSTTTPGLKITPVRNEGERVDSSIPEWRVRDSNQLNPDSDIFRPAAAIQPDILALSRLSLSGNRAQGEATGLAAPRLSWRARQSAQAPIQASDTTIQESPSQALFSTPPATSVDSVYSPPTASSASIKTPLHLPSQSYLAEQESVPQKKAQKKVQLGIGGLEGTDDTLQNAEDLGRFLLINEIPRDTKPEEIKAVVSRIAQFKVVIIKHLESKGCIFVVFYDPRQAMKLYEKLRCSSVQLYAGGSYTNLHCMQVSRDVVEHTISNDAEWERMRGCLESEIVVEVIGNHGLAKRDVESTLAHYGDVMWVNDVSLDGKVGLVAQINYAADFPDRDFKQSFTILAMPQELSMSVNGHRLRLHYKSSMRLANTDARTMSRIRSDSEYTLGSAAYSPGTFHRHESPPVTPAYFSRNVDYDPFDPDLRSISHLRERSFPTTTPERRSYQSRNEDNYHSERSTFSKHRSLPADAKASYLDSSYGGYQGYESPSSTYNVDKRMSEPGSTYDRMNSPSRSRFGQSAGGGWNAMDRKRIPAENLVYPEKIISGLDKRTTVMVKDVPNKLTRQELVQILDSVVPGGYDFVYLRFDFDNCCNVGYAFVNFSTLQSLYEFIKLKVGRKWNMFSSEKVLQVSYANIQGKMALINKFRNSAVMDVVEPWRPQIFYTSGTRRGQPEPFPESDNPAQRQRSADLRLQSLGAPRSAHGNDNIDEYQYNQFAPGVFDHGF